MSDVYVMRRVSLPAGEQIDVATDARDDADACPTLVTSISERKTSDVIDVESGEVPGMRTERKDTMIKDASSIDLNFVSSLQKAINNSKTKNSIVLISDGFSSDGKQKQWYAISPVKVNLPKDKMTKLGSNISHSAKACYNIISQLQRSPGKIAAVKMSASQHAIKHQPKISHSFVNIQPKRKLGPVGGADSCKNETAYEKVDVHSKRSNGDRSFSPSTSKLSHSISSSTAGAISPKILLASRSHVPAKFTPSSPKLNLCRKLLDMELSRIAHRQSIDEDRSESESIASDCMPNVMAERLGLMRKTAGKEYYVRSIQIRNSSECGVRYHLGMLKIKTGHQSLLVQNGSTNIPVYLTLRNDGQVICMKTSTLVSGLYRVKFEGMNCDILSCYEDECVIRASLQPCSLNCLPTKGLFIAMEDAIQVDKRTSQNDEVPRETFPRDTTKNEMSHLEDFSNVFKHVMAAIDVIRKHHSSKVIQDPKIIKKNQLYTKEPQCSADVCDSPPKKKKFSLKIVLKDTSKSASE